MIIIEFQGGLGNQMFQYAFYKALKTKYPSVNIKADLSNYDYSKYHCGFELLNVFNIKLDVATRWECIKAGKCIFLFNHKDFIKRILNKIWFILCQIISKCTRNAYKHICTNGLLFVSEYFNLDTRRNYYLSGFWQREEYFLDIIETLLSDFRFNISLCDHPIINNISKCESVSIHLRRGDYRNSDFDVLTIDYYKTAINYITTNITAPVFYIFSDDIDYAKKEFYFLTNKYFVTENNGVNSYKDMLFMSNCKHNIIANSTFSYWGAYLNNNKNKIVIAPNVFCKNEINYLTSINWIIINCSNNNMSSLNC